MRRWPGVERAWSHRAYLPTASARSWSVLVSQRIERPRSSPVCSRVLRRWQATLADVSLPRGAADRIAFRRFLLVSSLGSLDMPSHSCARLGARLTTLAPALPDWQGYRVLDTRRQLPARRIDDYVPYAAEKPVQV